MGIFLGCEGECTVNADCPTGSLCSGGYCVPSCKVDKDCPTGNVCRSNICVPSSDAGSIPPPDVDAGTPQKLCSATDQISRLSQMTARFTAFIWFKIEISYNDVQHKIQCKLSVSDSGVVQTYSYPGIQDVRGGPLNCGGPEYVISFASTGYLLNKVNIMENGASPFDLPPGTDLLYMHDLIDWMNAGFELWIGLSEDFTSTTYAVTGEILTAAYSDGGSLQTSTFSYVCH